MKTFDFCLYLDAKDVSEEDANRLFDAGCDDALSGAAGGVGYVHFAREAASLDAAVLSALRDVRKAGCRVKRLEIDEDGLSLLEGVQDAAAEARS